MAYNPRSARSIPPKPDNSKSETAGSFILTPPKPVPGQRKTKPSRWSLPAPSDSKCRSSASRAPATVTPFSRIQRFDRFGPQAAQRLRVEDFCQRLELPTSWKYLGNLEALAAGIRQFCSNPRLQLARFFERILFFWLIGNDNLHLKNWSLIETGPLIELAPVCDGVKTVLLTQSTEETALTLNDKKQILTREDLIHHLAHAIRGLNERTVNGVLSRVEAWPWKAMLLESALSATAKTGYTTIIKDRLRRLSSSFIGPNPWRP